jgi:2-iminobutanoate/2-iminopropanoate deaminase
MAWRESIDIPPVVHNNPIPMACRVGNMLFTSGISGADPATGQVPASQEQQAYNAFANLQHVLDKAGATPGDVVYIAVMLKDNAYRELVNKPWVEMFPDETDRPARHALIMPNLNFDLQIQARAVIQPKTA